MFLHNYGTTRAVVESTQLHHCTALQFTQEQVVSTTRQSTTTSLMENAVYTTTMEITHSW